MNATQFVQHLSKVALDGVFNPYSDLCEEFDLADAAATRRRNLRTYLDAVKSLGTDTVWMGRDLGYRGGRRTGLALTDEFHLPAMRKIYPGATALRATKGSVVAERTAAEIWKALRLVPVAPMLWNVFPFHPHEAGVPLSNRKFGSKELAVVDELNAVLVAWLGIRRVVCIGQDASSYARKFSDDLHVIRHPSYGGTKDFRQGIADLYGFQSEVLSLRENQPSLFAGQEH